MSFEEMKYEDLSWVRWDRMRWDFVDLLVAVADEHDDPPRALPCKLHDSCKAIEKSFPMFGVETHKDQDGQFLWLDHRQDMNSLVTSAMRDGMMMVSAHIKWGSGHPLEGAMEVPFEVGRIIHSSYFTNANRDDNFAPHVSDDPADEIRELLYTFVKLAFPDNFMAAVHQKNSDNPLASGHELDEVPFGWDANARLTHLFEDGGYVAPLLSTGIINGLRGFPLGSLAMTEHFGSNEKDGKWSDIAGYHLGMGMEDASLRRYWEDFPSIPDAFVYSERSNGYGAGMGFVARSVGLFVSQQVWDSSESQKWNLCTKSFNSNLTPILDKSPSTGAAMVVFSDYRGDAYIVSSVERSWDEYAPMSAVHGPLPEGFGIVGVWTGYDENRYTPRSFDDIIDAGWSEQITASAKYLRDCLAAIEAAKAQS
jgi:hypothetical protein